MGVVHLLAECRAQLFVEVLSDQEETFNIALKFKKNGHHYSMDGILK